MLHLKALAEPFRYRVRCDAEGWPVIPGRLGQIEPHDDQWLAVYSNRPRVFARLWAPPEVRRWQVGDQEARGWCRPSPCRRWVASSRPAGGGS
jgi:hypothetical protein